MSTMFPHCGGIGKKKSTAGIIRGLATPLLLIFGYFNVLYNFSFYMIYGMVSKRMPRLWAALCRATCFGSEHSVVYIDCNNNINPPSREKGLQNLKPLCRNVINSRVPRLSGILYIVMCCTGHVFATGICITNMCMEGSGAIAVFLTDTTPGCSSNAENYLVSKCGVGYNATTCNVDCNSIYSWSGSYWNAQGCSILGNPCGAQGECSSSVSDVCEEAPTPTPSPTSAPTQISTGAIAGGTVGGFIVICILVAGCMYCGGSGGGGGGGGGSSRGGGIEEDLPTTPGGWRDSRFQNPAYPHRPRDDMPIRPKD